MSVDAHCHVDLHPNPSAVVSSAVASGLRMVAVTTTPAAFRISSTFSDALNEVWPALGMHPEVVGTRSKDISLFSQYLTQVSWVGEIGLDGSQQFRQFWDAQVTVFERVLQECSDAGGKAMSIHSRRAVPQVISLLSKYPNAGTPVFHWFSGRISDIQDALALGAFFSVNVRMLYSDSGRSIIKQIPMDRLLTESDAPFAFRCNEGEIPAQIVECENLLAELLECKRSRIQQAIESNFDEIILRNK